VIALSRLRAGTREPRQSGHQLTAQHRFGHSLGKITAGSCLPTLVADNFIAVRRPAVYGRVLTAV